MASNIDIYLDTGGRGIVPGGSAPQGAFQELTRNDVYNLRILLQDAPLGIPPVDVDASTGALKVAIGQIDEGPTSGAFKLSVNGITSSAITYNGTAASLASLIYTAVSNNVSTVNQFGIEADSFVLVATSNNTALSISGDAFTLFPKSSVLVNTRRTQAANVQSEQIIKVRRNPVVYSDSFSSASTAGAIVLSKSQDGNAASNKNETYLLEIDPLVGGGQFILSYGTNSTTGIPVGTAADALQVSLSAVTGIGSGNIAVGPLPNGKGYTIAFTRALGNQDVTTALTLDASGVYFRPFRQATVTMSTAELDELFADEGTDTITPTIEIEYTESGNPKTLYQGTVTVRKDLITSGSVVPADSASYYTKSEANNLFVEDATNGAAGSIDATNRKAKDSAGTDSIDWQNRKLYDGSVEYLRWDNGIGFFNNSAVSQPSGANVVSNVISLGLIASSSTYGVLPASIQTLATTQSIWFGTVPNNSTVTRQTTMTGAKINDIVMVGAPADLASGLALYAHVVSANTVEIDVVNGTNGSVLTTTGTFRLLLIGY